MATVVLLERTVGLAAYACAESPRVARRRVQAATNTEPSSSSATTGPDG